MSKEGRALDGSIVASFIYHAAMREELKVTHFSAR
jgi:hypothetical protein